MKVERPPVFYTIMINPILCVQDNLVKTVNLLKRRTQTFPTMNPINTRYIGLQDFPGHHLHKDKNRKEKRKTVRSTTH